MTYVAIDGSVCKTEEEMQTINRRVELLLLPDKLNRMFGWIQTYEASIWTMRNVAKRGITLQELNVR